MRETLSGAVHDFFLGGRLLARTKGFAALSIILLALGMGATTAVFGLLNAVLFKLLPVEHPERLVLFTDGASHGVVTGTGGGPQGLIGYTEFSALRDRLTSVSPVFAVDSQWRTVNALVEGNQPEEIRFRLVSGNYFAGLGVAPALGRGFTTSDEKGPGSAPYAVISYRYWRNRFGLSPEVLGKRISIRGTSYNIIGVMPPQFLGETVGSTVDLWVPMVMQPQIVTGRMWLRDDPSRVERVAWLQVFGRLRPGVTMARAQSETDAVVHQYLTENYGGLVKANPSLLRQSLQLKPGGQGMSALRGQVTDALWVLFGIAGILMLTACGNIAGLMLARTTARKKELALRVTLGASRWRLAQQSLAESLCLAVIAVIVGAGVAAFIMDALLWLGSAATDPITLDLRPDWRVLGFIACVAWVASAIFGLAPALLTTRHNLNDLLKGTSSRLAGPGRSRTGRVVVALQVALSTTLMVAAGWFVLTLRNLERVDLGYPREKLVLVRVDPTTAGYRGERAATVYQDMQQRFSQIPGVSAVAYSDNGLFTGRENQDELTIEGYTPPQGQHPDSRWDQVGPGYFSILRIRLEKGREIGPGDRPGTPRVCLINRAFADKFFPHTDPIGKHITDDYPDTHYTFEIVGVIGNVHDKSLRDKVPPRFYIPALQPMAPGEYTDAMNYEIRTLADPASTLGAVRRQVAQLDPNIRLISAQSLDAALADQTLRDRLLAQIGLAAGILSVLIACIGLYAVLSYSVARRTAEIGVRIALGAQPVGIIAKLVREALALAMAGLAVGIPAALAVSTLVSSRFFGLTAADPVILLAVVLVFSLTAAGAAVMPARRAAGLDPMRALNSE